MSTFEVRPGISAVLMWHAEMDAPTLDLAAVLSGLVGDNFEIIVIVTEPRGETIAGDLRGRTPALPLHLAPSQSAAYKMARYDLIMTSAADGRFDIRELNRLMEAIERGADVAAGYRPGRAEGLWRRLRRWGLPAPIDYAFQLMRRELAGGAECSLVAARRNGYQVVEVPVSHRRPTLGPALHAESRAA